MRGRGRGKRLSSSPNLSQLRCTCWLRRQSPFYQARFDSSTSISKLRKLPLTPSSLKWPWMHLVSAACCTLTGWCRWRRHQSATFCTARRRRACRVLHIIPHRPLRARRQYSVNPRKSKGTRSRARCMIGNRGYARDAELVAVRRPRAMVGAWVGREGQGATREEQSLASAPGRRCAGMEESVALAVGAWRGQ
jgi:hypothetical protein